MPTTRSQRLADPDNSTASDSGSDLQPSSSEHGLTIDRFRRALSSTYLAGGAAPEVQLYYRKFESDETCDDLHCGATYPSYLYPQLLLETVCPHIDITPSERSKPFGLSKYGGSRGLLFPRRAFACSEAVQTSFLSFSIIFGNYLPESPSGWKLRSYCPKKEM